MCIIMRKGIMAPTGVSLLRFLDIVIVLKGVPYTFLCF